MGPESNSWYENTTKDVVQIDTNNKRIGELLEELDRLSPAGVVTTERLSDTAHNHVADVPTTNSHVFGN